MKLSQIAKKPQLVTVVIDDEDVVKEFGEPLEFHTWDRQPMDVFLKLSSVNPENQGEIIKVVSELVLDDKGKRVLDNDLVIPAWVLILVMNRIVDSLGKLQKPA